MSAPLHPVLLRQLAELNLVPGKAPDAAAFEALLDVVSLAYTGADAGRAAAPGPSEALARHDHLTGLPNRYLFLEELDRALARGKRYGLRFALMHIDLDRFKHVNDTLGHPAGDAVLKIVTQRLRTLMREVDILGRLGGDEFVVLVQSEGDPSHLSRIGSRLLHALCEPMQIEGHTLQGSASIGISVYPADATDGPTLLRAADAAMHQAKAQGRDTLAFFTADLAERAAAQIALEGELRAAIEGDQFRLVYQPKVDAGSGRTVGLEALLRWDHPERGLLAPGMFIQLAEDSGLIVPIGRWVLSAACRQMAQWQAEGLRPPRCAVNVSVRQLSSYTLLDDIRAAMDQAGVSGEDLEIEITESVLMSDAGHINAVLLQLHELGVHIAIDDFGTGYSSLAYLKQFRAQTLKIDRSFVSDLPSDIDDLAITRAVVAMGHSLGMNVVAEGVETLAQQDCLRSLGCDVLQGYLYGRPMSPQLIARKLGAALAGPARDTTAAGESVS